MALSTRRGWSLDPVLRVREMEQEREERLLANIHAEIARSEAQRLAAARDLGQLSIARDSLLSRSALESVHLRSLAANAEALRERMRSLDEQLVLLAEQRRLQTERYQAAAQRRELLVTLRTEDAHRRAAAEARREQMAADDAFLAMHFSRRCER
jgi:hypothetical protein